MRAITAELPAAALPSPAFETWRETVRDAALGHVSDFVDTHCLPQLQRTGVDIAPSVLTGLLNGGKCLRSTFMYLGWLSGTGSDSDADTAWTTRHCVAAVRRPMCSSATGIAAGGCPAPGSDSGRRWPYCSPTCAWSGPSR